ncbi:MAG: lysine transporter LysE [Chloroflexi bacterium]|nr:MAG: lysine transporter LysE [Chloroflexota bacterium]
MLLVRGMLIGFSIAAPVGPIGVLCIRRTLTGGRLVGFVSGLGAATADAMYGFIAAFGLTTISTFLVDQQTALRLGGGAFLVYLGVRTLRSTPATASARATASSLWGAYASTVALTITNPTTILSFVAIFAGLGIAERERNYAGSSLVVLGVFLGSALWWLILSGATGLMRARLDSGRLVWVNRVSGVIILAFGVLALLSVLR